MPCSRQCPWLVSVRFVVPALDHEKRVLVPSLLVAEAGILPYGEVQLCYRPKNIASL